MHPLRSARCVSQAVQDLIEKQQRGRDAEKERVCGKLLIKYESIVCHLSGHASGSPLKGLGKRDGERGGAAGKSIRRTEGRDKCLIHQSNYITTIKKRQADIMG